jgi:hypothetical protein
MERRPAMKKISTVVKNGKEIFKEHKLTIGFGLGRPNQPFLPLGGST